MIGAYRRRPRRDDLIRPAWILLGLFLSEAIVGGISVKVQLAWFSVMSHFLLAIGLVGVALLVHRRAGSETAGPWRRVVPPGVEWLARAVYALTIWVLLWGTLVTAAGPHGGDEEARRLGWPLGDVARIHAVSVDVLVVLVLALVVALVRVHAPRRTLTTASLTLLVMTAQGVLGYVQYFNEIPAILVGFHVFGAVLVFVAVQELLFSMRAAGASALHPWSRIPTHPSELGPTLPANGRIADRRTIAGQSDVLGSWAVQVHLVDGTYELFRQFYAPRPGHLDAAGFEIGATRAVVQSVLELLEGGATHLGVATDHVIESFRNDLWDGYKDGSGIDPAAVRPVPRARGGAGRARRGGVGDGRVRGRRRAGERRRGSGRRRPRRAGDHVHARQGPRPVVGGKVVQLDRRKDTYLDAEGVRAKFGVPPESIPDWLALVGDSADGFPGLPGFGAKTAAALLARFGHLEAIPEDPTRGTCREYAAPTVSRRRSTAGRRRRRAVQRPRDVARRRRRRDRRRLGVAGPGARLRRLVRRASDGRDSSDAPRSSRSRGGVKCADADRRPGECVRRVGAERPSRVDGSVVVEQVRPGIAKITLNRPERLNAMNYALVSELYDALDELGGDRSCRVIVLTGAGRGFCAGLDLSEGASPPAARGWAGRRRA